MTNSIWIVVSNFFYLFNIFELISYSILSLHLRADRNLTVDKTNSSFEKYLSTLIFLYSLISKNTIHKTMKIVLTSKIKQRRWSKWASMQKLIIGFETALIITIISQVFAIRVVMLLCCTEQVAGSNKKVRIIFCILFKVE